MKMQGITKGLLIATGSVFAIAALIWKFYIRYFFANNLFCSNTKHPASAIQKITEWVFLSSGSIIVFLVLMTGAITCLVLASDLDKKQKRQIRR